MTGRAGLSGDIGYQKCSQSGHAGQSQNHKNADQPWIFAQNLFPHQSIIGGAGLLRLPHT